MTMIVLYRIRLEEVDNLGLVESVTVSIQSLSRNTAIFSSIISTRRALIKTVGLNIPLVYNRYLYNINYIQQNERIYTVLQ